MPPFKGPLLPEAAPIPDPPVMFPDSQKSRRGGFTFVELIVGLAIMVMIASVVAPVMIGTLDNARIDNANSTLQGLATSIVSFGNTIQDYPNQLSQLSTAITTAQPNLCANANYSAAEAGRWTTPFTSRVIPTTGIPIFIGRARNGLGRNPATNTPTQVIIFVDSVAVEDATALNLDVDNDSGNAGSGAIQWTTPPSVEGLVTLSYVFNITTTPPGGVCL